MSSGNALAGLAGESIVRAATEPLEGLLDGIDRDLIPTLQAIALDLGEAALLPEPQRSVLVATLVSQSRAVVEGIGAQRATTTGLAIFSAVVRTAVAAAGSALLGRIGA